MKRFERIARLFLSILVLLGFLVPAAPAVLAAEYEDGVYQVPFSVDGLGRHNIAWSTATVHVAGGSLTIDFTFERVDPRDHAPQYDFLVTSLGTFYPVLNDETYTCTFSGVQIESLGTVNVSAQTSAMSQPYPLDYTLHIDDSSIPLKAAPSSESESSFESASSEAAPSSRAEAPSSAASASESTLSGGAIAGIVASAIILIGGAALLILRREKT